MISLSSLSIFFLLVWCMLFFINCIITKYIYKTFTRRFFKSYIAIAKYEHTCLIMFDHFYFSFIKKIRKAPPYMEKVNVMYLFLPLRKNNFPCMYAYLFNATTKLKASADDKLPPNRYNENIVLGNF